MDFSFCFCTLHSTVDKLGTKCYEESTPGSPSSRLGDADLYVKTSLLSHESLSQVAGYDSNCAINSSSNNSGSDYVIASYFRVLEKCQELFLTVT